MAFVTIKPGFQVTIPAKLCEDLDLREGDTMEATIVANGVFFRIVDRPAAGRVASILGGIEPTKEDKGRSENEIVEDVIAEVAQDRRERRDHQA